MSAVTMIGEISRDDAERLSNRIGLRLDSMADNWAGALPLIREAIDRNAYLSLGYASHGAYVSDRFGDSLSKLGVELRREIVRELNDAGLSTRAIAPVFGITRQMVSKDLRANEVATELPPAEAFADVPDLSANPLTGEVYEAGDAAHGSPEATVIVTETHSVKTVTGLDGKTYTNTPTAPRRTSIIDDARKAGWELRKAVERLERLQADDRFTKNKVEILAALQPHLDFANEVISDL